MWIELGLTLGKTFPPFLAEKLEICTLSYPQGKVNSFIDLV